MTGSILVYDPTAPSQNDVQLVQRTLKSLHGAVVGFIDNAKPNFQYLVDDLADLLMQKHGVANVVKRRKHTASMPANEAVFEELSSQCDLVIAGSGD